MTPEGDEPKTRRYPCYAAGCPMAGTIFPDTTQGTGERQGTCAWHYGITPTDIPRVTNALQAWQCVSDEVQAARRTLAGQHASSPAVVHAEFTAAWERLKPLAGVWEHELQPGEARSSRGDLRGFPEDYGAWSRRLERFLGARVVEVLSVNQRRAA